MRLMRSQGCQRRASFTSRSLSHAPKGFLLCVRALEAPAQDSSQRRSRWWTSGRASSNRTSMAGLPSWRMVNLAPSPAMYTGECWGAWARASFIAPAIVRSVPSDVQVGQLISNAILSILLSDRRNSSLSFYDSIRAQHDGGRDRDPECLGRLHIDDQFEDHRLFDRQVRRARASQHPVQELRRLPDHCRAGGSITHQPTEIDVVHERVDRRKARPAHDLRGVTQIAEPGDTV